MDRESIFERYNPGALLIMLYTAVPGHTVARQDTPWMSPYRAFNMPLKIQGNRFMVGTVFTAVIRIRRTTSETPPERFFSSQRDGNAKCSRSSKMPIMLTLHVQILTLHGSSAWYGPSEGSNQVAMTRGAEWISPARLYNNRQYVWPHPSYGVSAQGSIRGRARDSASSPNPQRNLVGKGTMAPPLRSTCFHQSLLHYFRKYSQAQARWRGPASATGRSPTNHGENLINMRALMHNSHDSQGNSSGNPDIPRVFE
ncbi:hypothetical protein EDD18DRAFT_1106386 [Armillaria luteobubalina]|uniref:Uncharacterized protein n=1 Tax=Armillaria luteobubalina TaxID=153913 RepID=A0AA39UM82_9AGAR|nr:hypothetical protein EDD18DRAFT_1106386 [Armillaria luteobubalina]